MLKRTWWTKKVLRAWNCDQCRNHSWNPDSSWFYHFDLCWKSFGIVVKSFFGMLSHWLGIGRYFWKPRLDVAVLVVENFVHLPPSLALLLDWIPFALGVLVNAWLILHTACRNRDTKSKQEPITIQFHHHNVEQVHTVDQRASTRSWSDCTSPGAVQSVFVGSRFWTLLPCSI